MRTWKCKLNGAEFKVMRLNDLPFPETITDNPQAIVDYLTPRVTESLRYNQDTENLMVVLLNTRKRPIGFEIISNGTLDTLLVHPREIFKPAILLGAAAIILA